MLIKFKHLKLHNFLSFGDCELRLDNLGYTLVSGVNNNIIDNAISNGSGKSSLWEAISWCLTGDTIRGVKDICNKFTDKGTFVELTFTIDNDDYKIIRYKDYENFGTNLKVFINSIDKSGKGIRDTQQLLETYLPDLTAQLLGSVIILGQGLPQRFTNNTPSGRKEILEKLSKSDFMIADIKDKLSNRKSDLNTDLRKVEDALLSDESKKSLLEKNLQQLKDDKISLDNHIDYDSEIERYEQEISSLNTNKIISENLRDKLNEQVENKLKEYQDWTSKVNLNYNHECQVIDEYYNVFDLQANLNKLDANIKVKKETIEKLDSIQDICPTCGQRLPDVHKVDTTAQKAELSELEEKYKNDKAYFDNLIIDINKKKREILDKLNKTSEEIKTQGVNLREELNKSISCLQEQTNKINDLQFTLAKIKLNKDTYEKQIKTIDFDIEKTEADIKFFSEKILYNNIEKDNIESHIDIVTKMMTFATRDFRGYLLSEVISFINNKAKEYCIDIFNTDKIDFCLDGNNIDISYNNKQYEALSGGEKQKIDIIIQFAIRDMLVKFLNFSSNILILDEIFDNIDSIGCEKVLNLINNKLNDIENIFIITHHSDISIPYDNIIKVIKDNNGISSIEGV